TGLLIWVFHVEIISLLKKPNFNHIIWLIPLGVFFSGIYTALQYWATRKKNFTVIARTRVVQSISGVATQIILGFWGTAALGLALGQIIKVSFGIGKLAKNFWKESEVFIRN
ncbi:oligosaccharide flippase family protein, partial [Acinetobacter baumannii]|nr:oligosaccharide flippase family protein [Acinetobacter baumannii]